MYDQWLHLAMVQETLGERIRRLRDVAGLSQSGLARRLDVTPQTVFQWEKGERYPRPNNQIPLAEILGVSPTYLMTGRDLADEEPDIPPEIRHVYARLGETEKATWLRIGWVLQEQQQASLRLVAEEPEDYAAFSEPELAEEARRESEDIDGA